MNVVEQAVRFQQRLQQAQCVVEDNARRTHGDVLVVFVDERGDSDDSMEHVVLDPDAYAEGDRFVIGEWNQDIGALLDDNPIWLFGVSMPFYHPGSQSAYPDCLGLFLMDAVNVSDCVLPIERRRRGYRRRQEWLEEGLQLPELRRLAEVARRHVVWQG